MHIGIITLIITYKLHIGTIKLIIIKLLKDVIIVDLLLILKSFWNNNHKHWEKCCFIIFNLLSYLSFANNLS